MSNFKMDPGFEDALMRTGFMRDLLEERTAAAAELATDLAPDDPATTGDDLHSSVFHDVALTEHGWTGRVGATNFKAPWFEEGAQGVTAQPFLRPAVESEIGPIEAGQE